MWGQSTGQYFIILALIKYIAQRETNIKWPIKKFCAINIKLEIISDLDLALSLETSVMMEMFSTPTV